MEYVYIDNIRVPIEGERNLLSLIRKAGIELPTFCYHSELSTYGACRMCVVENEKGSIMASCSEIPWDGMKVFTNTPKLQKHRKMILELLLAAHCRDCTVCEKSGKCVLQSLAHRYGVKNIRFSDYRDKIEPDDSSKCIVRDPSKCILCGDCVRMCEEIQAMGVLEFIDRGSHSYIAASFDRKMEGTNCVGCGQCAAVCPTAAITVKNDTEKVWKALGNKSMRVIAQIAPAVRVAIGEEFGDLKLGENLNGKIVNALKRLGFDEVYDTNLGADLTILEEVKEFKERKEKGFTGTMFTSCCPAWVLFCEEKYHEFLPNLSSCKSPIQMLGAICREFYNNMRTIDGMDTFIVSITPCTAKKAEAAREEFSREGRPDVDATITTQELVLMIKEAGIDFLNIEPESPSMPFGLSSGSGALFGVTGGVMEAALRLIVKERTGEVLREISFSGIRGLDGTKEAIIKVGENDLKVAVVSGLKNAEILLQKIKSGEVHYDFVEVMACRGGCIAGAGQPYTYERKVKEARASGIYQIDQTSQIKRSEENPVLISLYNGILKGKTHELLHCPSHKPKERS